MIQKNQGISIINANNGKPITVVPEFKNIKKQMRLHMPFMAIKNNNKDGHTHYMKHYMTDR